jgi:hypothetical protein
MQGDFKAAAEVFDEGLVGVRFVAAQGVVDVYGGEANAERVAGKGVRCVDE